MFRIIRPSSDQLEALHDAATRAYPTYEQVGATRDRSTMPSGYRHDERVATITAPDAFGRSRRGLREWQVHIGAGANVFPRIQEPGATVLVQFRLGLSVIAPCRIVYVIDEADRYGFAYGTLPGHPEEGEETFVVERSGTDSVRFVVRAFSRPGDPLVKATAPAARMIQNLMTRRYLKALEHFLGAR
jgi:uncharacterized protein (UPF0548 family)